MTQKTRPTARPPELPSGPRPALPSPGQPFSWKAWLILALLLGGMAVWQSVAHQEQAYPALDYSEFYRLLEAHEIKGVTLEGERIIGELRQPQTHGNIEFQNFQTVRPDPDPELVPALRKFDVDIRVRSQEQPFAVQLVATLLPWVLIIGVWLWLLRRAQQMMVSGGPLAGMLKGKSRRFDKQTSVSISFKDVAGLKAAKVQIGVAKPNSLTTS
jgi:cell division protease FtsH